MSATQLDGIYVYGGESRGYSRQCITYDADNKGKITVTGPLYPLTGMVCPFARCGVRGDGSDFDFLVGVDAAGEIVKVAGPGF